MTSSWQRRHTWREDELKEVLPPRSGIWRIGRAPDPLALSDAVPYEDSRVGNRFDSALAQFRVRYFATDPEGCFGECLARFRPDPTVLVQIQEDWQGRSFMNPGAIPAEWRQRRLLAHVRIAEDWPFLDVEALETREALRIELAEVLALYGYSDLDIAVIRGSDRRVTRFISQWAWMQETNDRLPRYAGIRYTSRLENAWELWAVFEEVPVDVLAMSPIGRDDRDLNLVAKQYGLTVY